MRSDIIDSSFAVSPQELSPIYRNNNGKNDKHRKNYDKRSTPDEASKENNSLECSDNTNEMQFQERSSSSLSDNAWTLFTVHFLQALNGCYKQDKGLTSRYLNKDNAIKLIKELGFSNIDVNLRCEDMNYIGCETCEENEIFLDASEN